MELCWASLVGRGGFAPWRIARRSRFAAARRGQSPALHVLCRTIHRGDLLSLSVSPPGEKEGSAAPGEERAIAAAGEFPRPLAPLPPLSRSRRASPPGRIGRCRSRARSSFVDVRRRRYFFSRGAWVAADLWFQGPNALDLDRDCSCRIRCHGVVQSLFRFVRTFSTFSLQNIMTQQKKESRIH